MIRRTRIVLLALGALVGLTLAYVVLDYAFSANYETYGNVLRVRSLLGSYETNSFKTYDAALCERLPRRAYVSGLIFNPKDRQTYYVRSMCYYEVAVRERDASMCDRVREKWHAFLDGSYFRADRCRTAVEQARVRK